ncbi:MAG: hypothetical protein KKB37_08975 [Alphaproteobacteria bacterium]|nr:hypothetical protein [Alphaproteobacteria bacterium]
MKSMFFLPRERIAMAVIVAAMLIPRAAATAGDCPAVLASAERLVLATAPGMDDEKVTIRLFVRSSPQAPWRILGRPREAVIGRAGMGWGFPFRAMARSGEPVKREGDKRTPAGFFALGASFGFEPSSRPGHVVLARGETVCVDDVRSPAYNTIQKRSVIGPRVSGEDMRTIDLYRHGMFVDYPSDRQVGAGSCIFLHLIRTSRRGTLGCIAMSEMTLRGIQTFSEPGAVLGVIPETARERFAGCLPPL